MSGEGVQNPYDDTQLLSDISDLSDDVADVQTDVDELQVDTDAIRAQTDGMGVLEEIAGNLLTDGAVQTIYINNAPAGIYRPICLKIDFANQQATETVVIRELYRISPGGALSVHDEQEFIGVVDDPIVKIDLDPTRYGVSVTIEKTGGTNRTYDWEVFYEI